MTGYIRLILAVFMATAALGVSAQDKIDKCIERLEGERDVETTYTERRSPKNHKLYRITRILTFNNDKYYERLQRAFEDERGRTVSAVKNSTQITYRFSNNRGTSTYTLTRTAPYTLIMSWHDGKTNTPDESYVPGIDEVRGTYAAGRPGCGDCGDEHYWNVVGTRTRLAEQQGRLASEIGEIVSQMSALDRSTRRGARRYTELDRKRSRLQKELAELGEQQKAMTELQGYLETSSGSSVTTVYLPR